MKIERLIGILSLLLQKETVTAAELSEKFEVSKRTVYRDINDLCCAGIPIYTVQGKGGGISVMSGYKIDKTLLTDNDMTEIISALNALDSVSNGKKYRQLMNKLSSDKSETVRTDNCIIIDLSSWDKCIFADKIELVKTAVSERRKISFRYFSPSGESFRIIEPYHLIFQWSSWYVWGYCTDRNDYRMFKLTRMVDLALTAESCETRNVPEYKTDKLRHTKGKVSTVVKFDKSLKWRIIDDFGTDKLHFDNDGNIIINFTWSDTQSLYQYILTFGDNAEIIEPKEARDELTALLKRMYSKYH